MHSEEFEALNKRTGLYGYHRYDVWSGCDGSCDCNAIVFQLNLTPAPGNRTGDQTDILFLGKVQHYSDSTGTMNVTVEGQHWLAPGIVARLEETRNGIRGIRSIGIGWGILPYDNEINAPFLWRQQDKAIFDRAIRCGAKVCN